MRLLSLFGITLVLACGQNPRGDKSTDSATPPVPEIFAGPPTLESAGETVPLTRKLTVNTLRPARVEVIITDGDEARTWRFAASQTNHELPLIGFKAGRDWEVQVSVVEPDGTVHAAPEPLLAERSEVPQIYPTFDVRTLEPGRQPGFTLLNMRSSGPSLSDETWTLLDEDLEPVWHQIQANQAKMVFQRSDGTFMGLDKRSDIEGQFAVRKDLLGQTLEEWHTDESWEGSGHHVIDTFAFHHDLIELPNGNFAVLAKEAEGFPVDDFPISYDDPDVRADGLNVNADRIVEFQPDGTKVRDIPLGPLMDTNRIGHDSLDPSFLDGRLDWIHGNGLAWDATSEAFLVSFRHQDAVIKVDAASGALVWILGNPTNWSTSHTSHLLAALPGTDWPYHQHSPNVSSDGNRVIVFDNGNWRSSPWDGTVDPDDGPREMQSRVVEYEIDEAARTVKQNWQFQPPDGQHGCPAVGGASYLDNGNVLATFGLVVAINGTLVQDQGLGDEAIRILEFDPADDNRVVGDVWISTLASTLDDGWQSFAAHRIASPYPPGFVLE